MLDVLDRSIESKTSFFLTNALLQQIYSKANLFSDRVPQIQCYNNFRKNAYFREAKPQGLMSVLIET